ncbi:MAG: hypothetical protein ACD_75C00975G0001, partial [uncultured bacterium]
YGFRAADYPIHYFEHPYLYADADVVTLAMMFIPRPPVLASTR